MTPAMMPLIKGAPEANATPRHNGRATRKTTRPAGRSERADEKFGSRIQELGEGLGEVETVDSIQSGRGEDSSWSP